MNLKKLHIGFLYSMLCCVMFTTVGLYAQTSQNMTLIGNWGKGEGQCKSVFALGTVTYYSVGEKLKIADFSNAAAPVDLGSVILPSVIEDIVKAGNYAYIVAGSEFYIVNVANPTKPALSGSYTYAGNASGVATKSTYAYIAAGDGGLRVVDIAAPAAPKEVAHIDTLGYAQGLAVSGDYVYVACGSKLHIINIKNPAVPVYSGRIEDAWDWYQNVTVRGSYVYICDYSNALRIFDVSNLAAPVNVGNYNSGARTNRVALDGDYAYIANGDSVKILNIADPKKPYQLASVKMNERAVAVSVGVNHIFVADRNYGMTCLDITTPSKPTVVNSATVTPAADGTAYGLSMVGSNAYVAYGTAGVRVINTQSTSSPALLGSFKVASEARDIAASGDYAYVAAKDSGLVILNVKNPAGITKVSSLASSGSTRGIAYKDNYVYLASEDGGFKVINVTNPASPVVSAKLDTLYSEKIYINGTTAYIAGGTKLFVVDVSSPTAPKVLASKNIDPLGWGWAEGKLTVQNNYLYMVNGTGLYVLNVSNPANPDSVKFIETPSWTYGIAVSSKYLYLTTEKQGLHLYDLTNPASPAEVGYYKSSDVMRDVIVNGNYAFVANGASGLTILQNSLITGVEADNNVLPNEFSLEQNYPNPFNPSTQITFRLSKPAVVKLEVYNILGKLITTLVNEQKPAGRHVVEFNSNSIKNGLATGTYFYRIESEGLSAVKKMLLIK